MDFTIKSITDSECVHTEVEILFPDGMSRFFIVEDDILFKETRPDDYESALIFVLRNFVKENNITDFDTMKTMLVNRVFKI